MLNKLIGLVLLLFLGMASSAQQAPANNRLRLVDTLTPEEKKLHNRVISRSEADSIINQYIQSLPREEEPVKQELAPARDGLLVGLSVLTLAMLGGFMVYYFLQQRKARSEKIFNEEHPGRNADPLARETLKKTKLNPQALETKINELRAELFKLSRENENLQSLIKEYNGIQHDYNSLKHGMLKAYKIKSYPGYDKSKHETDAIRGVFATENSVSAYAYEKFLKPILAIADANKNSPARTTDADKEKILDLLVSLSLLYIEYLYLRVNDLSIGGKMVERIQGFEKGNGIDASLLKKLDTEFGSRALVIKLALKNAGLDHLVYPVFDETNLNN